MFRLCCIMTKFIRFRFYQSIIFYDLYLMNLMCSGCFLLVLRKDPTDKRKVICDERLKELFEVDSFNGFTVSKLLTSHFIKTEQ